jgi:putative peptidoglycan lipid II flippase
MGKVVVIGVVAQANVVLLRLLASLLPEGSVTQYWYAARVVDLAQGAVAVGVGSALLPVIARDAAVRQWDQFRKHFAEAARLAGLVMLPAAALLLALASPVVALLFRHGAFDAEAAASTSATLRTLVPFMLALAGINIVKKAFFALDERNALVAVGCAGLAVTAGLGYTLSRSMGLAGLGLSLSLSAGLQLALYLILLRRRMGTTLGLRGIGGPLLGMLAAAVPAALLAFSISQAGEWERGPASLLNWSVLAAAGASAAVVYVALGWVLGVPELRVWLRRRSPR